MNKSPTWYHESDITQSYTAAIGRGCEPSVKAFLQTAGQLFATATEMYFDSEYSQELTMERMDPSRPESWLRFAGQLATGYAKAHYNLINDDADYRYSLGELMDEYRAMHGGRQPSTHSAKSRDRRYRHQGHQMIKEAIEEGVHTITAVYPVPVAVAARTIGEATEQLNQATAALPSAVAMAQRLARHSKQGNERFIQAAARATSFMYGSRVNYKRLQYDPTRFHFAPGEDRPVIGLNADAHEATDTTTYFSGCPAILGGSVAALNQAIAKTIESEQVYERMLILK